MGHQESSKDSSEADILRVEQRGCERVKAGIKLTLGKDVGEASRAVERPALTRDISRSGIACTTQHRVEVGDELSVEMSTLGSPAAMNLPERLTGRGRVVRIERKNSTTRLVALQFEEAFMQKMEFGFFMAWLLGREQLPDFA